jgi:hypothetical protein
MPRQKRRSNPGSSMPTGAIRYGGVLLAGWILQSAFAQTPATPSSSFGWSVGLSAPQAFTSGTQSQQMLGGSLGLEFDEGILNHTLVSGGGTHTRTWKVGSPFVTTDLFDAYFQQGRLFRPQGAGLYGRVETWFNTSLGMALQKTYATGLFSPSKRAGPTQVKGQFDLRYVDERLYGTAPALHLFGSHFEGQAVYRKLDASGQKDKYFILLKTWVNPMWTNERALQAYGTLTVSIPFGHSVCLDVNPIEENYLRNAPPGKRPNYVTSKISVKIQRGSNPEAKCF